LNRWAASAIIENNRAGRRYALPGLKFDVENRPRSGKMCPSNTLPTCRPRVKCFISTGVYFDPGE
jgi:hypothetical protein